MTRNRRNPREFADCPCAGKRLNKLLHPAVLTVLGRAPQHGYGIVQAVSAMPTFAGEKPDPTGVYRCLKSMEAQGLVRSSWDLPDAGPPKRSYRLTENGRRCLRRWIETLGQHRVALDELLKRARRAARSSSSS